MVIVVRFLQSLKVSFLISVVELEREILVYRRQNLSIRTPINVTLYETIIEVKFGKHKIAPSEISVTVSGTLNLLIHSPNSRSVESSLWCRALYQQTQSLDLFHRGQLSSTSHIKQMDSNRLIWHYLEWRNRAIQYNLRM